MYMYTYILFSFFERRSEYLFYSCIIVFRPSIRYFTHPFPYIYISFHHYDIPYNNHTCMYECVYVNVCMCIYIYVYLCMCVEIYMCMCVYVCICIFICIYICICICLYVHIYIDINISKILPLTYWWHQNHGLHLAPLVSPNELITANDPVKL